MPADKAERSACLMYGRVIILEENHECAKLFTSESVTEGHPDKLCDQVADAILDAIIAEDPMARVACEVTATTGMVFVMGK